MAVGVVVALVVAACGEPLPDPEPGQNPAAYSGLAVDEGRIEYAIGKVADIVSEELEASGVPGAAVAVVHDGGVAYSEGFGVRSTESGEQVDTDTVFSLASAATPVSATVVAAQDGAAEQSTDGDDDEDPTTAEDTPAADDATEGDDTTADDATGGGSVWSTPVQEHLPWFELSDPRFSPLVTVGDLFAHRSGLPAGAGDDLAELGYDRPAVLHGLRNLPLDGFRDTFAYSDYGLTAGAEAVAMSTGTPWAELARESIFDPLGMDDSTYSHEELLQQTNRAVGHVPAGEADTGSDEGDDAPTEWAPASPERDPGTRAPAGGLSSSVSDMARWMTMVLDDGTTTGGGRIVPVEPLREALTPQATATAPESAADRTGSHGYGFIISDSSSGRVQWGHSGAFPQGSGTAMLMMPSLDLGIITLTNAAPEGTAETINSRFADLAQYGDPALEWREVFSDAVAPQLAPAGDLAGQSAPLSPEESRPLDELAGDYESDHYGPVTVRDEDDRLLLDFGRDQQPWPLEHWDGDTFAASPSGANWPAGTRGSVGFDDDELTIELLDRHGLGTFTRVEQDDADD